MEPLKFAIVATDILIFRNREGVIEVAVQTINRPPHYVNIPGFVGGVLKSDETSEQSARRIITEKTGLASEHIFLHPLKFYDAINRDRRGRVVSIAYIGIMSEQQEANEGVSWVPLHATKNLAYDHNEMLSDVCVYFKNHLFISTIALNFMPKEFTITELMTTHEYLLNQKIDKRNFYKFIRELPIVSTKKLLQQKRGRPALVYKKPRNLVFFLP